MQIQKLILIISLLFLFGCHSEKKETNHLKKEKSIVEEFLKEIILNREDLGLMGNVRSTLEYKFQSGAFNKEIVSVKGEEYHFISTDSLIEKIRNIELKQSNFHLFNESGHLIKDIRYVIHNKPFLEEVEEYIFNNNEKLIEWNRTNIDKELTAQKTFKYDQDDRLIEFIENYIFDKSIRKINTFYKMDTIVLEEVNTLRGGTTSTWQTEYDRYGERIERNPREREGKEYDKNGNLIKLAYEGMNGYISPFSITYDYDYKNNKINETEYDSINNIVSTERFYYNNENELIQSIKIDTSGTAVKQYNKNKYLYGYTWTPFNEGDYSFHSFWVNYDKYGNVIKRVDLQKDDNGKMVEDITKTALEYDEFGNWTSKSVFENDSLTTLFEREIKYF